jgi:PHS family inorganic phosphate transporter-like MFS transporter
VAGGQAPRQRSSGVHFVRAYQAAYDLLIIGVVSTMIVSEGRIVSYQKSLPISVALLTSAADAVLFGQVADRLGRRKIYGYQGLVLAVGAIASAGPARSAQFAAVWSCH